VGRRSFIGVVEEQLLQIHIDNAASKSLSSEVVQSILVPNKSPYGDVQQIATDEDFSSLIVKTKSQSESPSQTQLYWVDLSCNQWVGIPLPTPEAKLVGCDPRSDIVLFLADQHHGLSFWISPRTHPTSPSIFNQPTLKMNQFLGVVAAGSVRLIDYQSLKGESLTAKLWLSPDYDPQQIYPLVVSVYPGSMVRADSLEHDLNSTIPLNLQFLTAKGYVALEPSMPPLHFNLELALNWPF
jgi:hypothetical protein